MTISLLLAESAMGEAGLSEIINSRSLWVEKPYVLIWSGDHDIGHFSVDLVRAESVPIWRPLNLFFSHDGLNPTELLVSEITGFTRQGRLFLMKIDPANWNKEGDYAVLDLKNGSITNLSTDSQLRGFLVAQGLSFDELRFHTFDDQYRKHRIILGVQTVAVILALLTAVTIFAVRRRKGKKSQQSPSGDVLKAAPEEQR